MSQESQSCLRFSLEESVWFQRGQEVEELVSISLDPNITIQENDQYVTIRGSLELTGEYKRQNGFAENDGLDSIQKWVHSVVERDEGICEFAHQFPVDITIPTYRIRDLNEIDVEIETFDYVLPERSCLKLTADLNITGLYGDQVVEEKEVAEAELDEALELKLRSPSEESFDSDYENEVEVEVEVEVSELKELVRTSDDVESSEELIEEHENELEFEPFEVEARKEEVFFRDPNLVESSSHQPDSPDISFSSYRSEQPHVVDQEAHGEMHVEGPEVEEEIESPPIEKTVKQKSSKKKSMSISEFLARKENSEDLAKLKVCIVQYGESVDTLAERYQVSVQHLLKVNQLEINQDVHEGQVLYIPQVHARK
ncbi:stage VI sporulation protein D [Bacillus sp. CGMCC 1.16607]|uniref:stage VI sporulation protein D n=1 Tax=Bacillus sp. CGMCC 1.16607 TaxID=3351842 RepID=UPI00362ABC48